MQDERFDQFAAEAASSLRNDRELFLEATATLRAQLSAKADEFAGQGYEAEECVALAMQSFGSPHDLSAKLLAANSTQMRRRSARRWAFFVLVIPLALLLMLYLVHGRTKRADVLSGESANAVLATMPMMSQMNQLLNPHASAPLVKQTILPFWTAESPMLTAPPMVC